MKTFETEKGNIPEGATHYRNEDKNSLFTWLKVGDDIELWCDILEVWRGIGSHVNCIMDKLTEIPQTKEVEWVNGDRVIIQNPEGFGTWDEASEYLGSEGTVMAVFINTNGKEVAAVSHDDDVCICWMLSMLSKPESEADKLEREELESAYDLYRKVQVSTMSVACDSFESFKINEHAVKMWTCIAKETGYRKGE